MWEQLNVVCIKKKKGQNRKQIICHLTAGIFPQRATWKLLREFPSGAWRYVQTWLETRDLNVALREAHQCSELTKATKKLKGIGRISSQSWAQNVVGKPLLIVPRTIVEQFYNVQCLKLSIFKLPIFLICCK